ncbi:MAG: AlpA family phage regulatory protein [Acidobacteriota bacterium]
MLTNPRPRLGAPLVQDLDSSTRDLRFLRFPAVRARTGLSRSTIWRLERAGRFPRHRRISTNAVAWVEDEVAAWMRAKLEASA